MSKAAAADYSSEEMMTVEASRKFRNGATCFVGVGQPSVAACLARATHAPHVTLVYESGAIGAKPKTPPRSIADPELADTALFIVSVPEIFGYWLQAGRIDIGFLGTAQIDRFGNLNTTVIGDYKSPKVRLPGGGGAPMIAAHAKEIVVIVSHSPKTLVSRVDFLTTPRPNAPVTVVTDLGVLRMTADDSELVLVSRHPGVELDQIREATGWPLISAGDLSHTQPPSAEELSVLRQW